jgi:cell wall-associated NlpC family hydrolase
MLAARVVVAIAFAVALVGAAPSRRADAIVINERASTYIASTSRMIALELREARDLPASEQEAVAGRQIHDVAGLVAILLDTDVDQLRVVWSQASLTRKIALFTALSQLGVPYKLNADAPFIALDCSALTRFAWAQAGEDIERGSAEQYARSSRVLRDESQVGDLVWYPGHIMMSLGVPDLIVHARSGQRSVEIHRIDSTRIGWMRFASPLD